MQIFLSYASDDRAIAEKIASRLELEDHTVFFDREGLQSGKGYDQQIRQAINDCDLMIFLISPDAVSRGRYTLTELKFAKQQWRNVTDRILPVVVRETPSADIPAVLSSLQMVVPVGNLEAEVVARVAQIANAPRREPGKRSRPRWIPLAAAAGIIAVAVAVIIGTDVFREPDRIPPFAPPERATSDLQPPAGAPATGDEPDTVSAAAELTCELTGDLEGCDLTLAKRICAAQQQTAAILNGTAAASASDSPSGRDKVYIYGVVHSSDEQDLTQMNTLFRTLRNQLGERAADPPDGTGNAFGPGPVTAQNVYNELDDAMLIVNSQLLPPYVDNGGSIEKRDGDSTLYFGEEPEEFLTFTLPKNNFKAALDLHRAAYFYSLAQHSADPEEKMNHLDQAREFISNACKAR
ncbi:MAG: toll/interleukin-1 receptor domain-containing protein [Chromatiales bacterium]